MCEVTNYSDGENSSKGQGGDGEIMPKDEVLDCDSPVGNTYSMHVGDHVASSSGSNVRSSLMGMGFKPYLVDRAIEEHGDSNIEVLLEVLFSYSADQRPKSEASSDGFFCYNRDGLALEPFHRSKSSDSMDGLFDNNYAVCPFTGDRDVKEDPDISAAVGGEKMTSLLRMSFSSDEIEFAMNKLGVDAPIDELVDFIFAARIAENCERDADSPTQNDNKEINKECTPETLFGTMEKTLRLLEMGFSENEISAAIDKHGSEVPVQVLADSIVAYQSGEKVVKFPSAMKVEERHYEDFGLLEKVKGKRPKEEYIDERIILKRPKPECDNYLSTFSGPTLIETRNGNRTSVISRRTPASGRRVQRKAEDGVKLSMPNSCQTLDLTVIEPPYFFYGNVTNLSHSSWVKISQFLYEIEPEFVHTREFSALNRREGYVHNLPAQNRFHIYPKPPMTVKEAVPHTSKWWPLWDNRKHLSSISTDTSRASQICDELGKMLIASRGKLSGEQQKDLLHQCDVFNLVWAGQHRLAPIEPEYLDRILGYPLHHTQVSSLTERLQSLVSSFQVDTLAYHLSVLRPLYPGGLTVLSMYSGIGGAEIALNKLDIYLKAIVSVEPSEIKRRILKQWWERSGQRGELVQLEGIHKLSSTRLDGLIKRFGGFDLVICQNPSADSSSSNSASDDSGGFDFALFYEFVRVVQRVRSAAERSR